MHPWKLTLAYDGTTFHGWQVQPGLRTVQGTLAHAIRQVTKETVLPQGSGRTDTGVHALGQVATFSLSAAIPAPNLLRALNHALPPSIRILAAEPVPPTFHARHSSLRKTYEYRLFERRLNSQIDLICPPFLAPYVWDYRFPLDLSSMLAATPHLLGTHDFTSFAATDPDLTHRATEAPTITTKTLHAIHIHRSHDLLLFRFTGSGFLHHMVRNLVGTLTNVGRGALTLSDIPTILAARDRTAAGPTAPATGLFLVSVDYPETKTG